MCVYNNNLFESIKVKVTYNLHFNISMLLNINFPYII